MKTSQVIIGLAASIGVLMIGWYLYMQQTPTYKRTFKRGLSTASQQAGKVPPATKTADTKPAKAVEKPGTTKTPSTPSAAPTAAPAAPTAAPAAPTAAPAAPTAAPAAPSGAQ